MARWVGLWAVVLLVSWPTPLLAQGERFELGRRLRAFEAAWDHYADPVCRRRATKPLLDITQTYLSLQWGEAGRALDQARFYLEKDKTLSPSRRWAESLHLAMESRLLDVTATEVTLMLKPFYKVEEERPQGARLRLRMGENPPKNWLITKEIPITAFPLEYCLSLRKLNQEEQDYVLQGEIVVDEEVVVPVGKQTFSLVQNLEQRVAALKKKVEAFPKDETTTDRETARELVRILGLLADKRALETNYPASCLLAEVEQLLEAIQAGKEYYGGGKPGQFRLKLATPRGNNVVRLLVPDKGPAHQPRPLVLALHGAGGSENLFFEAYGNGKVVRLCEERNWLLAAPRSPLLSVDLPLADLVDELSRLYAVDPHQVFVVGHSMGAGQALQAVQKAPKRFAAVAALGGGGRLTGKADLKPLSFFIGIGTQDFALRSAQAITNHLKKADARRVVYREYPDAEHMVIVQQSLPDVFAFFDEVAREKGNHQVNK